MNTKYIFILAIILFAIALYSCLQTKPMTFWTNQKIGAIKIEHVKRYNLCNAIMWFLAAVYFSVATFFEYNGNIEYVNTMCVLFARYGIISMIAYYTIIYFHFKKKG